MSEDIIQLISELEKITNKVEIPPAEVDADLAIPAFAKALADKSTDKPATKEEIIEKINSLNNPFIKEIKIVGQYINLRLDFEKIFPLILEKIIKEKDQYGHNQSGQNKTVLIEYSSPNIAKPMHMGHARNNAIGHALRNIYEANGYRVIAANYIGDWGMSFAKIMLAYQKWGDEKKFQEDPVRHLLNLYIQITQEIKNTPDLEDETRALFKKLADGDPDLRQIWQKFYDVSLENFKRVYQMLGIDFEDWHGESFYEPFINDIVQEALDKKVATQEAGGPVVVNLDQFQLPSFLLRKSDGASLYGARDLALAKWRLENYHPDKIIHVVGHEQELYLKQIFKTLGLMGYPEEKFSHVSYGIVTLDSKKISTRSGNIIFLEDGLKEAIKMAKGIPEVGIGAIIFNMLYPSRERDIAFNWSTALNLQGNSAPYLQYAFVRAKSILNRANFKFKILNLKFQFNEHERKLVKFLFFYPEVVRRAQQFNAPHLIATFLNELVQEFNRFYANDPILTAEENVKQFRLALIQATAQIIKNGLALLGISVPERM